MTRTFASLFCGCGGFDLGFIRRGFRCIGAFDNDPTAVAVHHRNLGSASMVYDLSQGLQEISSSFRPDVLLAGSPCQGFSTAGKRLLNDPRNKLLLVAGHIAIALEPHVFLAENVAAVSSGEHGYYWHGLKGMLRDAGYWTAELLCEAEQMGLAQVRHRRVLIAWNQKKPMSPCFPYKRPQYLQDALRDVDGKPNHCPIFLEEDSQAYQIARKICPGQKLSNVRAGSEAVHTWQIPEIYGETSSHERAFLETLLKLRRRNRVRRFGDADPVHQGTLEREMGLCLDVTIADLLEKGYIRCIGDLLDLVHTYNGKFRRLSWHKPSLTVDTRFTSPRYFLHPVDHRGFTVREAARIQGFPDDFLFSGDLKTQIRHVGNAVPPPVAYALADLVYEALFA